MKTKPGQMIVICANGTHTCDNRAVLRSTPHVVLGFTKNPKRPIVADQMGEFSVISWVRVASMAKR